MVERIAVKRKWPSWLDLLLFSGNIAYSIGYTALLYGFTFRIKDSGPIPASSLSYLFLRSAIRINSFLRLDLKAEIGHELVFLLSVVCLAAFFLIVLRVMWESKLEHRVLKRWTFALSLLAVPVTWLVIVKTPGNWLSIWTTWPVAPAADINYRLNPSLILLTCELVTVGVLLTVFARKRYFSAWVYGILLAIHCAFWAFFMWTRALAIRHLIPSFPLVSPTILFTVFPLSCAAWIIHSRQNGSTSQPEQVDALGRPTLILACSVIPLTLLSILWLPHGFYRVAHPKNVQSVVIKVSRGQCFAVCPAYTITIRGDGQVKYFGEHNVRIIGEQIATLRSSQVFELLRQFDDIDFFSLDDRAFERCNDTPKVSVSLSVDGRDKTVISDAHCRGANSGPQARLIKLTSEIDGMVGSGQWVSCRNNCIP